MHKQTDACRSDAATFARLEEGMLSRQSVVEVLSEAWKSNNGPEVLVRGTLLIPRSIKNPNVTWYKTRWVRISAEATEVHRYYERQMQ